MVCTEYLSSDTVSPWIKKCEECVIIVYSSAHCRVSHIYLGAYLLFDAHQQFMKFSSLSLSILSVD